MESICNKLGNNILSVDGDEDGLRKAHVNIWNLSSWEYDKGFFPLVFSLKNVVLSK